MKEVFIAYAHDRWEQDAPDELVGLSDTLSGADLLVKEYIKQVYCYHSTRFYICKTEINSRAWPTVVKHYSFADVLALAKEFGVYPKED